MTPLKKEDQTAGWKNRDLLRAFALFFFVWIALQFLWVARTVFMTAALGLILGIAMVPPVDWLERKWRMKRGLAASMLVLLALGSLAGIGALVAPALTKQIGVLREKLPAAIDGAEKKLGVDLSSIAQQSAATKQVQSNPAKSAGQPEQPQKDSRQSSQAQGGPEDSKAQEGGKEKPGLRGLVGDQMGGVLKLLFPFVSTTVAAVGGILVIIFLALFISTDPKLYRRGFLHMIPHRGREKAEDVLDHLAVALRGWLFARVLAMVVIGLVTFLGLLALKVKAAAALGLIAGLFEFVPFVGPILSAIPAIGMGLADSSQKGMYVVLLCIAIQQLEGHVLTPLLLKRNVDVPPVLTIVGVAAFGVVFGILGVLIAEPLLVTIMTVVKMLYVEPVVGDHVVDDIEEKPAT